MYKYTNKLTLCLCGLTIWEGGRGESKDHKDMFGGDRQQQVKHSQCYGVPNPLIPISCFPLRFGSTEEARKVLSSNKICRN